MEITSHINNDICLLLARVARDKADEIKVPMVIAFADARERPSTSSAWTVPCP